jgi:hypothetical protein
LGLCYIAPSIRSLARPPSPLSSFVHEPVVPQAALLALVFLVAAYVVPDLIGHDPWKQDEAYSFGIIYNLVRTGDWVVPRLAADPFMEKPPAYYITAAGFARLFSPPLQMHDAARLATGLYPDYSPYLRSPTPRWASMASTKSAARWSPIHRV